jgi:hypothetical protein
MVCQATPDTIVRTATQLNGIVPYAFTHCTASNFLQAFATDDVGLESAGGSCPESGDSYASPMNFIFAIACSGVELVTGDGVCGLLTSP